MKLRASIILASVVSFSAAANEVVFPPLNKDTIVGVWEAIRTQPLPTEIDRIEISKDGPSFFAYKMVGSSVVNVFRMISCEITDEKISLRFHGTLDGNPFDWFFEGKGEGTTQEGAMSGRLFTEVPPAPKTNNAFFVRGSWTRGISDASREVEQGIAKARSEATR